MDEETIKEWMDESGKINKGSINRKFDDESIAGIFLAMMDDYTRRLLNLTEVLTFYRMQMRMKDERIQQLTEEIEKIKLPKKPKIRGKK